MSSYLKLFQDFLQKKESDVSRRVSAISLPEEDNADENGDTQSLCAVESSANASVAPCNNNNNSSNNNSMEHSYTRDNSTTRASSEMTTGLAPARTILVRRPPQCPSCHTQPLEENELVDGHQALIPVVNEIAAKEAMNECARIAKYVKNNNSDDDDWESRVNQLGWTNMQKTLFTKVVRILDNDQLGRLAYAGRQNEAMQRRVVVDKSAARMRKVLASVAWDARLTQWLHCLLMECLPAGYMASYLDILQTLKTKLPILMDKMLFSRPMNISQELLAPVMKKQWELLVNTKSHKLAQNAVIVALPAMPASGPIPHRLQKWYQHLASITQIVQVTLPMSGEHIPRQPLEQIAEQIVSITRVKIQDLRNENPTRNIILIGFNAGAAMALQVAMSENIACVVCMGFAYNTLHGVRGAPDDRMLDIKIPILFVVGQNSARTSPEEVESLRERMQSETSLVVVGSADDVLRVPKSRRKIENVTQSMVDAMVVDEIYEFIKKILTNPPGPRIPSSVANLNLKQNKSYIAGGAIGDGVTIAGTTGKGVTQQRKRKQDGTQFDQDQTPSKTKYVPHIGRPRTRPLLTATSTPSKATTHTSSTPLGAGGVKVLQKSSSQLTNDDLNSAIQSILNESNEHDSSSAANTSSESVHKQMTNFELVAQSKSTPLKTSLINPLQKSTIIGGTHTGITGTTSLGTKIKMIPSNHFVQLKPPLQSQSKIYTIKTTSMLNQPQQPGTSIGSIVTTAPNSTANLTGQQQQIFTLKSPNGQTTQYVTAASPLAQQKYTVVKNSTGGTTLQLTTPSTSKAGSNLDLSNIIDMPIIFADNDGNLSDSVASNEATGAAKTIKPANSSGVGQLIISQKIIKEATTSSATTTTNKIGSGNTIVIGKSGSAILQQAQSQLANKPNKVVFINRNTMKPFPNIMSRSNVAQQLPKYTKVVVTNPKTAATTLVPRPATTVVGANASPIASTVKQINLQTLKSPANTSGILNVSPKTFQQQFQIISSSAAAATSSIVTTAAGADKTPTIRNIVVKPGGLKQIPPHLKTQLLNRNLTVRKLVNLVPVTKTTATTSISVLPAPTVTIAATTLPTSAASSETPNSPTSVGVAAIQTSPKIITLNPINPSSSSSSSKSD